MYANKEERAFLLDSKVGKAVKTLVDCGQYVCERDNVTAAERIRRSAIAQLKCIAIAISIGTGKDGGVCSALPAENMTELPLDTEEIGLALCATITLLETGTELAEAVREAELEAEATDEDDEKTSVHTTDARQNTGETAFGMPVVTLEQLDAARAKVANAEVQS